jgi:hypothetical protein
MAKGAPESPTPEAPRPASLEMRAVLYGSIGELAMLGQSGRHPLHMPLPARATFVRTGVPQRIIPAFVRAGLPRIGRHPFTFAVRAVAGSHDETGVLWRRLVVDRTTLHNNGSSVTEWEYDMVLEDDRHGYTPHRHVTGHEYPLPAPMLPDYPGGLTAYLGANEANIDSESYLPTIETSGPWPEDKLVVPEAEQLLRLITVLQRLGSDG